MASVAGTGSLWELATRSTAPLTSHSPAPLLNLAAILEFGTERYACSTLGALRSRAPGHSREGPVAKPDPSLAVRHLSGLRGRLRHRHRTAYQSFSQVREGEPRAPRGRVDVAKVPRAVPRRRPNLGREETFMIDEGSATLTWMARQSRRTIIVVTPEAGPPVPRAVTASGRGISSRPCQRATFAL
jgi:hypothetical protein